MNKVWEIIWLEYDGGVLKFLPRKFAPYLLGKMLGSKGKKIG